MQRQCDSEFRLGTVTAGLEADGSEEADAVFDEAYVVASMVALELVSLISRTAQSARPSQPMFVQPYIASAQVGQRTVRLRLEVATSAPLQQEDIRRMMVAVADTSFPLITGIFSGESVDSPLSMAFGAMIDMTSLRLRQEPGMDRGGSHHLAEHYPHSIRTRLASTRPH